MFNIFSSQPWVQTEHMPFESHCQMFCTIWNRNKEHSYLLLWCSQIKDLVFFGLKANFLFSIDFFVVIIFLFIYLHPNFNFVYQCKMRSENFLICMFSFLTQLLLWTDLYFAPCCNISLDTLMCHDHLYTVSHTCISSKHNKSEKNKLNVRKRTKHQLL